MNEDGREGQSRNYISRTVVLTRVGELSVSRRSGRSPRVIARARSRPAVAIAGRVIRGTARADKKKRGPVYRR